MTQQHGAPDDNTANTGGPGEEGIPPSTHGAVQSRPARDGARKAGAKPGSGTVRARGTLAGALVALAAVLSFAAVPALYLRNEVLDTDHYTAIVTPLAADPAVQAEISDKVTAQITDAVDIEGIARDAMAELGSVAPRAAAALASFAPALAEQTKALVHTTVSNYVASPQFQDLWTRANRVAHEGIVNLAAGNTGGAVSIDERGVVTISTKEIIARVKALLVEQGIGVAARIPEVEAHITLFQSPGLVRATEAIGFVEWAAPALAWLTVLSAVAAIATAPPGRRLRTTGRIGLASAAAMGVLALTLDVGLPIFLGTIPSSTLSPAAAQSLADAFLVPLRAYLRLVAGVGLLIAAAAFLAGRSRPAQSLREGLRRAGDYVAGTATGKGPRPWQHWLGRFRRALEAAVIGAAVLVLVLRQHPTTAGALWTAVLAGLSILLIELLCRSAVASHDRDTPAPSGEI